MRKIDIAYCAGVIDSDGTIGVKKSTYSMRVTKDSTQANYSERISVKQVEPQAIELLHKLFDGCSYIQNGSLENGRSLFSWVITDKKAAFCLKILLPYLRIKKEQAKNCLHLRVLKEQSKKQRLAIGRGHVGSAHRSEAMSVAMEGAYLVAKELNRVGK